MFSRIMLSVFWRIYGLSLLALINVSYWWLGKGQNWTSFFAFGSEQTVVIMVIHININNCVNMFPICQNKFENITMEPWSLGWQTVERLLFVFQTFQRWERRARMVPATIQTSRTLRESWSYKARSWNTKQEVATGSIPTRLALSPLSFLSILVHQRYRISANLLRLNSNKI